MTALKPLTNLRVLAAKSERYPGNKICSQPECAEPVADFHHCFPRSQIAGDSWFVIISNEETGAYDSPPVPHVTGLCRAHHNEVEEHRAWIRLEEGQYNWYARVAEAPYAAHLSGVNGRRDWDEGATSEEWIPIGTLNPQPGSVEGKPKRKKREKQPTRKKAVFSVRVPRDELEDGYEVLSELIDAVREKYGPELGWTETAPPYFVIVAALAQALQ